MDDRNEIEIENMAGLKLAIRLKLEKLAVDGQVPLEAAIDFAVEHIDKTIDIGIAAGYEQRSKETVEMLDNLVKKMEKHSKAYFESAKMEEAEASVALDGETQSVGVPVVGEPLKAYGYDAPEKYKDLQDKHYVIGEQPPTMLPVSDRDNPPYIHGYWPVDN